MLQKVTPTQLMEEESGQLTFLPKEPFKPPVHIYRPLPEAFEDTCKRCEKSMKSMPNTQWGHTQPHTTFHCEDCKIFLYIYPIPGEPDLVVWGDKFRGAINITKRVDELRAERAHKEHRRKIRLGE